MKRTIQLTVLVEFDIETPDDAEVYGPDNLQTAYLDVPADEMKVAGNWTNKEVKILGRGWETVEVKDLGEFVNY